MRTQWRVSEQEGRVSALLSAHGHALRGVARRFSLCDEDAEDALQRSLEIYVRRLASVERATEAAWMKVVVRHEALAIRRTRGETVAREDVDLDARPAADLRAVDDRLAVRERSARSAEALRGLKRDEALALLLKAEGHSYREIAASQGWTYTKVNRAITEGRARFLKGFRAIEEGEACDRLAPVLADLAAGTATAAQLREARPHLRHCASCRAALRALHAPLRRRVAALLPLGGLVLQAQWLRERLGGSAGPRPETVTRLRELRERSVEDAVGRLPDAVEHVERVRGVEDAVGRLPDAVEHVERVRGVEDAVGRLPDAVEHVERVRGVEDAVGRLPDAVEHVERAARVRVPAPRAALDGLVQRIAGSDLATSVQLATGTGGGRAAAVAALVGVCVSGVGAGGYCVATALLPDAPPAKREQRATARAAPQRARHATTATPRPPALTTATPAATRSPRPASPRPRTGTSTSTSTTSAASPARREFSFESSGGSAGSSAATVTVTAASAGTRSSGGGSAAGGSTAGRSAAAAASSGGEFLP